MREQIQQRIRQHIVETWLNGDGRGFDDNVDLIRSGILDSFTTLALASFLDTAFQIQVDAVDINSQTFQNVNAVTDMVLDKLANPTDP